MELVHFSSYSIKQNVLKIEASVAFVSCKLMGLGLLGWNMRGRPTTQGAWSISWQVAGPVQPGSWDGGSNKSESTGAKVSQTVSPPMPSLSIVSLLVTTPLGRLFGCSSEVCRGTRKKREREKRERVCAIIGMISLLIFTEGPGLVMDGVVRRRDKGPNEARPGDADGLVMDGGG